MLPPDAPSCLLPEGRGRDPGAPERRAGLALTLSHALEMSVLLDKIASRPAPSLMQPPGLGAAASGMWIPEEVKRLRSDCARCARPPCVGSRAGLERSLLTKL